MIWKKNGLDKQVKKDNNIFQFLKKKSVIVLVQHLQLGLQVLENIYEKVLFTNG